MVDDWKCPECGAEELGKMTLYRGDPPREALRWDECRACGWNDRDERTALLDGVPT